MSKHLGSDARKKKARDNSKRGAKYRAQRWSSDDPVTQANTLSYEEYKKRNGKTDEA